MYDAWNTFYFNCTVSHYYIAAAIKYLVARRKLLARAEQSLPTKQEE